MRLTESERTDIIAACKSVAADREFSLSLFGSRVNDDDRGGDIDLLLLVDPKHLDSIRLQKHCFLQKIKERIGEQKIDFVIATPEMVAQDEFLQKIRITSLLLFSS